MLTYSLCPVFKFASLTFIICIIDIIMFIVEASLGLDQNSKYLLQIKS